ncbi:MAG: hypothetical protein ABIP55_05515 [Tepidisphaeraceae bacterium]
MPRIASRRRDATVTLLGVMSLLVLFAVLAWSAVKTKSSTADEPVHALAAWLWSHQRDYRVDPEDPPLWGYWMALPNGPAALRVDLAYPDWRAIPRTHWTQTPWWRRTLHQTPGNDGEALVHRSRRMALPVAVALGTMIAWWGWRVGAGGCAIVASTFFALDPNFLGHGALVKNDVTISLVLLALAYALWRGGQRMTWRNVLAIGILCGVAMSVKFSGLLSLPIVALLLLIRALLTSSWTVIGRRLESRGARLAGAGTLAVSACVLSVLVVWASYGFRYAATPGGADPMNIRLQAALAIKARLQASDPSLRPTAEMLAASPPGLFLQTVVALDDRRLMPQAWLNGLLYTYHSSLFRAGYLLGEIRQTGWWYYFPLAMLVKTPSATLAAAAAAIAIAWILRRRTIDAATRWTLICLLVPPAIYLLVALRTNLNLGLRHVFPVYPPLFICIGWATARARRGRRIARIATVVLLLGLATETLLAWPNFIAFFNSASGGSCGGLRLLGDSNLDWGQDLPLLARWQKRHSDRPIHLLYFGSADPAAYVDAQTIDPVNPRWPATPDAVIAVSATYLQGLYLLDRVSDFLEPLRHRPPLAVLGGSIYLFEPPTSDAPATREGTPP